MISTEALHFFFLSKSARDFTHHDSFELTCSIFRTSPHRAFFSTLFSWHHAIKATTLDMDDI